MFPYYFYFSIQFELQGKNSVFHNIQIKIKDNDKPVDKRKTKLSRLRTPV